MLFDRFIKILRSNLVSSSAEPKPTDPFSRQDTYQSRPQETPPPVTTESPTSVHYRALELPDGASFEAIKQAYKKLVKRYHPDRFHNDSQKRQYAEQVTQRLNEAYAYFEKKFGR